MKILWFSWKDISHPLAGGAETVTHELLKRAVADGHEAILITSRYDGCELESKRDGYRICRVGNRWTVYWQARHLYKTEFVTWPDVVIDECNTIPFFARFYVTKPRWLFFHQLCREIWFYQMAWPFSWIGYMAEPVYLWLLRKEHVITVSQSTCNDLCRYGFDRDNVKIISEGITLEPVDNLRDINQFEKPTVLSLGALRPMKRALDIVRAYEFAKQKMPDLQLIIAGSCQGQYATKVRKAIEQSDYSRDIQLLDSVDTQTKIMLMQKSHVLVSASVKEGWGLVVTEANSQGIPAVVYNVDGLRDSTIDGINGIIAKENTPAAMADAILMVLGDHAQYLRMRNTAWIMSTSITFDQSFHDLAKVLGMTGRDYVNRPGIYA